MDSNNIWKLPNEIKKSLARDHNNGEWTLDELRSSIMKEIRILETEIHTRGHSDHPIHSDTPLITTASFYTNTRQHPPQSSSHKKPASCIYCKQQHSPNFCNTVTNPQDRLAIVKKNNLCFNCLSHHKVSQCNSKFRCRYCRRKHHTSLCTDSSTQEKTELDKTDVHDSKKTTITLIPTTDESNVRQSNPQTGLCLLKTAIAMIGSYIGISLEGNILFDEGAQRSFITQEMATKLNLQPSNKENISLASFGSTSPTHTNLPTGIIQIHTLTGDKIPISVLIVPRIAPPLQNTLRTSLQQVPHLKGLQLAHPITENENFEISVLIGADHYWSFVQDHVIRGDGPTAVQSKLGYLLSGPLSSCSQNSTASLFHVSMLSIKEVPNMERFWNVEAAGVTPSEEDPGKQFLRSYIQSSITCQPDGSYSLRFPWKENHPPLPSNYYVCERRMRSLVRRLAHTPDVLRTYSDIISEQVSRGFIEKVETTSSTTCVHYIPHHPVRKESSTTPIRIVYDCSCRQSQDQPSLNDCLMVGPTFLNDMCSILLRFRTHKYGLSTDIEKAFLHVTLHESDRDYTRFLWLSDPTNPESSLIVYHFKAVLFGSVSSPFMLNAALHCHLQKYPSPITTDIENNLYVDNVVSGCNTELNAKDYYNKSRSILSLAKFNLRSWASNSKQVQMLTQMHNVADKYDTTKVLGLMWHTPSDTLSLASKITTGNYPITKREILQCSSSIFDPLGFITPVTIQAKVLLQELWKMRVDWDKPLEENLQRRWNKMVQEISEAVEVVIPRQYFTSMLFSPQELHVFADASMKAYGAVAYFKQDHHTSLIMSKTKVSPLKTISLPRLELMAAVLAIRLAKFIISSIKCKCSIYLWSDSQIVLHWINSSKKLKPFIGTRVNEIISTFPPSCWQYCPTSDNPADLLTRGITSQQLALSTIWKRGPTWLTYKSQWPTWNPTEVIHSQHPEVIAAITLEETEAMNPDINYHEPNATAHGLHHILSICRYNNLTKFLSVSAYILRFIHNCKNPTTKQVGSVTPSERTKANLLWIRNTQHQVFINEIKNIKSSSHRLPLVRQLRLFIDNQGALRCGGRIHNAPTSELTKFPYLLPTKHPFTKLVIYDIHQRLLHAGTNSTVTALRQAYWIPSARQTVRNLLRHCVICQKVAGRPYKAPDPPPLIKARIQETEPFNVTGVDFTGALYVREKDGESKAYICLFTCAVTRAVHLEIVTNLTVEEFLQAFRRFSSRKSLPRLMISDNASTYLAAADEINDLFRSSSLSNVLSKKGVTWQFIPKRAPWYGGFWERLIGMTKASLKKVLGRTFATLSTLQTVIVEIEGILNDRPLTYISSDVDDLEPLTPAHLLYGRRIIPLPYLSVEEDELDDPNFGSESAVMKRAKIQALILKHFWTRWKSEYLTTLREFHKTTGNNIQQVKVGDVVLVHDDTPRVNWKCAVIESVIRGNDGLIRAASIRTATGKTTRPITKLYPLEVTSTDESHSTDDSVRESASPSSQQDNADQPNVRSLRKASARARKRVSEWASILRAPPEDVVK